MRSPLNHVGEYQGEIVAANILGEPREANYEAVPRVAFTDPQAAAVGAGEARFSATAPISNVSKTATYTHAYDESNGFLTLLSDGERLTSAHAVGPEAGEWLQQATLPIRARVSLAVLRDTIQPFPTSSEIYSAALKALHGEITAARHPAGLDNGRVASFPGREDIMEFLVEFEVNVPDGTPESEVKDRESAEASAAAKLVDEGHLLRLWKLTVAHGETKIVGLYLASSDTQLDGLLGALPLYEWMDIAVTPLEPHPNDPAAARREPGMSNQLPDPRLTRVYRLEATLAEPLDLGDIAQGHRRIVPLTGGTVASHQPGDLKLRA